MENIEKVSTATWIAFVCMVFGMFMAVLDIQIVASSLQEIQGGLSATRDEINWVQSSYLIAEVIIIPLTGWLTRAFSTRFLFAFSCAGFTLMSLACAMAWNLQSMIIFRALQGLIGGTMIPTVFSVIFRVFPLSMRSAVTVVVGLVVTIAPAAGPVIGGYITDYFSWHFLFIINVIPGIIVTYCVLKFVNFDKPNLELLKDIDYLGIFLIAASLGTLQYILEEGVRKDWFDSELICNLAIFSAVTFVGLIYHELTSKNPIINLYALRDRNFLCSCLFSFAIGWGLFVSVFITPIYLGYVIGLNSLQVGQFVSVVGIFQLISAPCAGYFSKKFDLRIILFFGLCLFSLGLIMNYDVDSTWGFDNFFFPQAVRGFSLMFCFVPITNLAFITLSKDDIPTASGLFSLMRNLGGAIGLAVTNTWMQNWTKQNYSLLRNNVIATNEQANNLIDNFQSNFDNFNYADPAFAGLKTIYLLAQKEAYIISFNQVCAHLGALLLCLTIFILLIKKPNIGETSAAEG